VRLEGKTAMITGASTGIGRASALRFGQVSPEAGFVTGVALPVDGGFTVM
jgi:NADP-dependent 3-hydroxy acid dehydrogenase YdfG